ncbi:YitT family protein [Bacillus sonorensis]|uniref:YitT family protein n=1 Tax=Bacillus sonorensis TaxID=119858 RepID=UPI00227EFA15|nr:YitT family protein [Bacillus sonorensis]MCY7856339.1 YitT family protein [Bacillus sonorensis]MCY8025933.1 YitT family protein [Bacillus sonorensis]MCY8034936.1 YitT family protein [Bacillus sonorensis]MCY8561248.1 YitT family protein [Bacillus sonorensis]
MKTIYKDVLLIMIGTFLIAASIEFFVIPNKLGDGSTVGIALVLYYLFHIPTSISTFVINLVFIAAAYKFLTKKTILYTTFGAMMTSIFLKIVSFIPFGIHDMILGIVFGALLMGAGLAMIFIADGSTGGTTLMAYLLNYTKGYSISKSLFYMDSFIIFASVFAVGINNTLYTFIFVYLCVKIVDIMIEGFHNKKAMTIMSDQYEKIAQFITREFGSAATIFYGYGYYANKDKRIIYVVIKKNELLKIKKNVQEIDPNSFIVVHEVKEVVGGKFGLMRNKLTKKVN